MFTIETIFPKTVVRGNIGRDITADELDVSKKHKLFTENNYGNVTSIEKYILDKELPELKIFIETGINHYVKNILVPNTDIQFYITQSWFNYTEPGEFHHKHEHPNSIISGVFYFNADPNADKIYFFEQSYKQITIQPKEWNYYNSHSWWFPAGTGDLLIFPSNLTHMVEETVSRDTRVSLAFNVFAKGYLGDENSLTALHL